MRKLYEYQARIKQIDGQKFVQTYVLMCPVWRHVYLN